jgi:hypothetical protein
MYESLNNLRGRWTLLWYFTHCRFCEVQDTASFSVIARPTLRGSGQGITAGKQPYTFAYITRNRINTRQLDLSLQLRKLYLTR